MDLLKDITEEVRKDDGGDDRADGRVSNRAPSNESSAPTNPTEDGEEPRDTEHVCAFCRESFDASRGACPHCGAEIVLRGVR